MKLPDRWLAGIQLAHEDHMLARAEQEKHQYWLAYFVSAVTFAFLALGVSVSFKSLTSETTLLLSIYELVSFAVAYFAFRRASKCREAWVRSRVASELQRHWAFLDNIFLEQQAAGDVTSRAIAHKQFVHGLMAPDSQGGALSHSDVVESYWIARRGNAVPSNYDIETDQRATSTYLLTRVKRQREWFSNAIAMLSNQLKRRESNLQAIYIITVLAIAAKIAIYVTNSPGSTAYAYLSPLTFLILIGVAATSYISVLLHGQHYRGVLTLYRTTLKLIDGWIARNWGPGLLYLNPEQVAQHRKLTVRQIIEFEHILIEELKLWSSVASEHAPELAA